MYRHIELVSLLSSIEGGKPFTPELRGENMAIRFQMGGSAATRFTITFTNDGIEVCKEDIVGPCSPVITTSSHFSKIFIK